MQKGQWEWGKGGLLPFSFQLSLCIAFFSPQPLLTLFVLISTASAWLYHHMREERVHTITIKLIWPSHLSADINHTVISKELSFQLPCYRKFRLHLIFASLEGDISLHLFSQTEKTYQNFFLVKTKRPLDNRCLQKFRKHWHYKKRQDRKY